MKNLFDTNSKPVKKSTKKVEKINNIVDAKERAKFEKDRANGFISNVIDQTLTNLGSSFKNFGIIFGSDKLKGFGDVIENNYKLGNYKTIVGPTCLTQPKWPEIPVC